MTQSEAVNIARRQVKSLKDVATIDVDEQGNVMINGTDESNGENAEGEVIRVYENGNWIYNI
jgi:hypothetical protein